MKLSDKIKETCCGALADRNELVEEAEALEFQAESLGNKVAALELQIEELARYYNGF